MQKVKFNKKIFAILLLLILMLSCTLVSVTFSYFSDKKQVSSPTMQIGRFNDTNFKALTAQQKITSANLVCGNTFTKTVTVTNKANIGYYIRVYAVAETQVYEKQNSTYNKVTKTDLVSVTGVSVGGTSLSKNASNNKYVYTTPVATTTSELTFTFTFKVSDNFTEELNYRVVNGEWTLDDTLTTTITYYAEIIQQEAGLDNWS